LTFLLNKMKIVRTMMKTLDEVSVKLEYEVQHVPHISGMR